MIGQTLSHYKIIDKLGAGGQGEVYLAEDSRLDRKVALKILPQHLSERADLRKRFEREARAVSSLNHPHICTLYDIGEQDGIHYLVMEHLEGETLAARLEKGALPLEQTLQYAIQVADALDKAHRQGVVHRDLKPGNIMLVKSGAKLLDFGLAKLQATETPTNLSALPTEQASLTAAGTILGTLQYMAPEQLEGKEADGRTDIFAFGAVVYEMATGKKAFEGQSQASLIAAIMEKDPPAMAELQPMTPQLLDWVVKRCLAKEPDERVQSAADLMAELRLVSEVSTQVGPSPALTAPAAWKRAVPWSITVAIALVAVVNFWILTRPEPQPLKRFVLTLQADASLVDSPANDLAISPDGKRITFLVNRGGTSEIYMRPIDELIATPIPGTRGAATLFLSPDGESVGFAMGGELRRVSVMGGPPRSLCDLGGPGVATWDVQDWIAFSDPTGSGAIYRVPAAGGEPETLALPDPQQGDLFYHYPEILPGAKALLFTVVHGSGSNVAVLSLDTGEQETLIEGGSNAHYAPTGHLVYRAAGTTTTLMAVPFDLDGLSVTGDSVTLLENIRSHAWPLSELDLSFSEEGTLIYVPSGTSVERSLVWVDPEGNESLVTEERRNFAAPRISPDGTQIALTILEQNAPNNVWIYDLRADSFRRLTFEGANGAQTWSPDGKWIAFQSNRDGPANLYRRLADGSGSAERLTTTQSLQMTISWSSDGSALTHTQAGSFDTWVLPMEGDSKSQRLITGGLWATFSPDGQWLAYSVFERGQPNIYVSPYQEPEVKWLVSGEEGGAQPVWSPDGTELFYRSGDKMLVVSVQTGPTLSTGKPRVLFERSYVSSSISVGYQYYDISPDGKRFLMMKEAAESTQINVVLNWFEELKRLVPTDQ